MNKKVVLISGCSGQLGVVFAKFFLKNKFQVIGLDIHEPQEILSKNFSYRKLDISKEDEVKSFFSTLPNIDILINNAGKGVFTPFEERTLEEFQEVINVNLVGLFLLTQQAIRKMKSQNNGKIINIASIYGVKSSDPRIYGDSGRNNSEVYSMTKASVINFTKYLAAHYASYNIQINSISPGGIFNNQAEEFVKNYVYKTPANRMGQPEDLLGAIELLSSDNSSYINGQNIIIDGGFCSW